MSSETEHSDGFSLIEVLIAVFLLGLVAVALIPALYQGIRLSSEQSAVATATRELNALVETARSDPNCANLSAVAVEKTITDGAGRDIVIEGEVGDCPASSKTVSLTLTATDGSETTLATIDAVIYVP